MFSWMWPLGCSYRFRRYRFLFFWSSYDDVELDMLSVQLISDMNSKVLSYLRVIDFSQCIMCRRSRRPRTGKGSSSSDDPESKKVARVMGLKNRQRFFRIGHGISMRAEVVQGLSGGLRWFCQPMVCEALLRKREQLQQRERKWTTCCPESELYVACARSNSSATQLPTLCTKQA